jgi:hypothetical protein
MGRGVLDGEGRGLKFKATEKVAKVAEKVAVGSTFENPYPVKVSEDKNTKVVEVAKVVLFPENTNNTVEVSKNTFEGEPAPPTEYPSNNATSATSTTFAQNPHGEEVSKVAPKVDPLSESATFEGAPPKKPEGVPRNGVVGDLIDWHRWLRYATDFPYSLDDFEDNEVLIGDSCWQMAQGLDDEKLREQLVPIFWPYAEALAKFLVARHTG